YPNSTMPDPLAIQIGSITSLTFQGPTVNMGMSITDPTSFYNLVNNVVDPAPPTPSGDELTYIRTVASQTNLYTQRVRDAANAVTQQGTYPTNNTLADQLKIVAKLVKGGLKTRLYMVSFGGFDNHSLQTNTDTTTGTHATLLQKVSDAIKAFVDDCTFLGIQNRVIGMTFSEFGRRIKSNSSVGTDHGAAAPMILFGNGVRPGIWGTNPAIPANVTVNDNIPFQYDFRSIYASVLDKWFCVSPTILQQILFSNFQSLDIVNDSYCRALGTGDPNQTAGEELISNYPNPFVQSTTIKFKSKGGHTLIQIIDMLGRVVSTPIDRDYPPGTYTTSFDSYSLPTGVYYARFQNGPIQQVKSMLKVR
ncbi:MAG TPA: DUF1501 domain-containing protein, partial [Chitinophagaceae bacterium]|nr:DUF1501 domain-containing protein [Chitinophagaceae bacterium]